MCTYLAAKTNSVTHWGSVMIFCVWQSCHRKQIFAFCWKCTLYLTFKLCLNQNTCHERVFMHRNKSEHRSAWHWENVPIIICQLNSSGLISPKSSVFPSDRSVTQRIRGSHGGNDKTRRQRVGDNRCTWRWEQVCLSCDTSVTQTGADTSEGSCWLLMRQCGSECCL